MLGVRALRDRSSSHTPDGNQQSQHAARDKDATQQKASSAQWVEPSLAQNPSYRDHSGGSYYGVSEHMQPLGEAPNARVRTRVKAEGGRKSVLGKTAAAGMAEAQDTPEGTPAPQTTIKGQENSPPPPQIVVKDDDDDDDYAPKMNGKKEKKERKPRLSKAQDEARPSFKTKASTSRMAKDTTPVNKNKKYDDVKLRQVVEAAKERAMAVGKPDLAWAVNEIYERSLTDANLTQLLENILAQTATAAQTKEFTTYVKAARRKLRNAKAKEDARTSPESANASQSLPLRSPSAFALPTTNAAAPASHDEVSGPAAMSPEKIEDPSRKQGRPRSRDRNTTSASPTKKRSGSVVSDSSLTDLTSNPDDDMEVDAGVSASAPLPPQAKSNGVNSKDHAAERGSLAAPNRNLKRSSAEAEIRDDESVRVLAAKKARLSETVTRDVPYQESNLREPAKMTSRLRLSRGRNDTFAPPSIDTSVYGGRRGSTNGSRAVSTDADSPLSEPDSSRQSTPQAYRGPARSFGKRAKTKQSPEKKHAEADKGTSGVSGASRDSPVGSDDNEELSENNDFCSACGGSGYLLCCDGCDRSFHFTCLDPPINQDASELNEPWYCYICIARRPVTLGSPEKPGRGLFAALFSSLKKQNPYNFSLPQDLRDYFEGVATDRNGSFVEAVNTRTRNRPGYDSNEIPDFTKIKDGRGNTLLCYSCGKSSHGARPIIQCDFCGEHWHLDCLDPPLANPPARSPETGKKLHDWMCPLHADHELRRVDTSRLNARHMGRKLHVRKPKNAKSTEPSLQRGFRNNGVVDVVDDDSDDSGSDFYDEETPDDSIVYRLPASGIKLDFIDKVKNTRIHHVRSQQVYQKAQIAANVPSQLARANFSRRPFREQQLALNLAQFASSNKDLDLGSDEVEHLIGTLIAEAPPEVVEDITSIETVEQTKLTLSSTIPPSPPNSDQPCSLSAQQRQRLQMLQELIRRRLEGTSNGGGDEKT